MVYFCQCVYYWFHKEVSLRTSSQLPVVCSRTLRSFAIHCSDWMNVNCERNAHSFPHYHVNESGLQMSVYKTPEVEDHPLDWVDINHPLNRISLPFYNLALEIHRRCLITSVAAAVVAITIPLLFFLTAAHLPYMYFHWVPKFMRLVTKLIDINDVICVVTGGSWS